MFPDLNLIVPFEAFPESSLVFHLIMLALVLTIYMSGTPPVVNDNKAAIKMIIAGAISSFFILFGFE